jgi:hypothetical protein
MIHHPGRAMNGTKNKGTYRLHRVQHQKKLVLAKIKMMRWHVFYCGGAIAAC